FRMVGSGKPHLFIGRLGETNGQLATGRLDGDQPCFIQRATQLIFHSRREGDHALFVRDVDRDVKARRISQTDEGTPYLTPYPSPDGRHIVFASAANGTSQIYVMGIDSAARQQ